MNLKYTHFHVGQAIALLSSPLHFLLRARKRSKKERVEDKDQCI